MLEHSYMTALGARVGFPVVDVETLETCLITSYNGASQASDLKNSLSDAVCRVLRSSNPDDEILVTDA